MYRHFTTLTSLVRNSNKYNYIERGRSNMNGHYNTKQARVKLSFGSTSNVSEEKNLSSSSSPFPRWPSSMIESEGDYRDEAHLERIIGGPLYESQHLLLDLPVPKLDDTIKRLLPSVLPLSSGYKEGDDGSREEKDNENDEDLRKSLIKACASFPHEALDLQRRLLERKNMLASETSWLQSWWNKLGYLSIRSPIVVNVSYFFQLDDDLTLPKKCTKNDDTNNKYDTKSWSRGILRGASILTAVAEHRRMVCSGSLPHDRIVRKGRGKDATTTEQPLCSVAYKYMFHACRIPRKGLDTYRIYDPNRNRHCIVACRGQFFSFDFVNMKGNPLSLHVLEDRLRRCVELATSTITAVSPSSTTTKITSPPPLGLLTTADRDSWANARVELLRVGGKGMKSSLEILESGALLLCLDDEEPTTTNECANLYWTGGTHSGHNRWYDKSIQVVCTKNGKAGLIGEHSMMDGGPTVGLCSRILNTRYGPLSSTAALKKNCDDDDDNDSLNSSTDIVAWEKVRDYEVDNHTAVVRLFENCPPMEEETSHSGCDDIHIMIRKAKTSFVKLVNDHELNVRIFRGYGSTRIKRIGFSPDAYVQMAMQVAAYRLFEEQVATYESTQVRIFRHGRTETTRTVSHRSAAFVRRMGLRPSYGGDGMGEETIKNERNEKLALLRSACEGHVMYLRNAAKGQGVDRHLMGLSLLQKNVDNFGGDDGADVLTLFNHPLNVRSKHWRVSTSTLPNAPGFGQVVPDGLGIGYEVRPDDCIFTMTGLRRNNWTEKLGDLIEEAMVEIELLNETNGMPSSRL